MSVETESSSGDEQARNPYAPPRVDVEAAPEASGEPTLASRGRRLLARIIDFAFVFGPFVVSSLVATALYLRNTLPPAYLDPDWFVWAIGLALGVAFVVNLILIGLRGQSLGKLVTRTRIVRLDGRPARFVRGVLLRELPLFLVPPALTFFLPLGGLAAFALLGVDALFIFRSDHRCLHDLVAGTRVVRPSRRPKRPAG